MTRRPTTCDVTPATTTGGSRPRSASASWMLRYFMFFLSPLLWAARRAKPPNLAEMSRDQVQALMRKTHQIPSPPVNSALTLIFSLETPLGHVLSFPWGTSILAVLQKPESPEGRPKPDPNVPRPYDPPRIRTVRASPIARRVSARGIDNDGAENPLQQALHRRQGAVLHRPGGDLRQHRRRRPLHAGVAAGSWRSGSGSTRCC